MKNDELKKVLDEKYETYVLMGAEEEFGEPELFINGYTIGIMSLIGSAVEQYPDLKDMISNSLKNSNDNL